MKLLSINIFTDTIASFEDECFADKRGEDASTAGSGQHEPPRLPQGVRAGPTQLYDCNGSMDSELELHNSSQIKQTNKKF